MMWLIFVGIAALIVIPAIWFFIKRMKDQKLKKGQGEQVATPSPPQEPKAG